MATTLIVLDTKPHQGFDGGIFLELIDLLKVMPPQCREWSWAILDLWATFPDEDSHSLNTRSESDTGVQVTWDELWKFAENCVQVIEGQFIGYRPEAGAPFLPERDSPIDRGFEPNCDRFEIVLEAVDSTYWKIGSKNSVMIEQLSGHFKRTEIS